MSLGRIDPNRRGPMKRRMTFNPHQMSLSKTAISEIGLAATAIADHWSAMRLREPGRDKVKTHELETGESARGMPLRISLLVMHDADFRADGGVDIEDCSEAEGALYIPIFVNVARGLTFTQIREVLMHEVLHVVFWAKARADKPMPIRASELKTDEDWANYMYSESEYIARVLVFVHSLEDELERLWRSDKRRAAVYAMDLMTLPTTTLALNTMVRNNAKLSRRDDLNALYYYATHDYYSRRFADAVRYSVEDKLAVLKKGKP